MDKYEQSERHLFILTELHEITSEALGQTTDSMNTREFAQLLYNLVDRRYQDIKRKDSILAEEKRINDEIESSLHTTF